jgi:hypothetical protein
MENDRAGERGCARRAWAGHSADTGASEVAEEQSQRKDLLRQRAGHSGQSLLTGCVGERSNEPAGSRRRSHSNGPSQSLWAGHAAGSDG